MILLYSVNERLICPTRVLFTTANYTEESDLVEANDPLVLTQWLFDGCNVKNYNGFNWDR